MHYNATAFTVKVAHRGAAHLSVAEHRVYLMRYLLVHGLSGRCPLLKENESFFVSFEILTKALTSTSLELQLEQNTNVNPHLNPNGFSIKRD